MICVLPVLVFLFQQDTALIKSVEGKDLYMAYCASCHGADAKGSGPASAAMKVAPPDLTLIARRSSSGKFVAGRVEGQISGNVPVLSHGSAEMPVWGPLFRRVERDQDLGLVRLRNVVKYLDSIQAKK